MKSGDRLVIFIDKIAPDFKQNFNDEKLFPTNDIFDFKKWQDEEGKVYKKVLKEDEDVDYNGNKGYFSKKDKFTIVILSTAKNEEDMKAVINNIPKVENFDFIQVS